MDAARVPPILEFWTEIFSAVLFESGMLAHADVHAKRDLPADRRPVSVLPPAPAAMAELHQAQSQLQRLLRQGPAIRGIGRPYTNDTCFISLSYSSRKRIQKKTQTQLKQTNRVSATCDIIQMKHGRSCDIEI